MPKVNKMHSHAVRGNDFYPTPIEAITSLIHLEKNKIPKNIWEPCCGKGAITKPLENQGYNVVSTDLVDYGCGYEGGHDFLKTNTPEGIEAIVTNPPYKIANQFVEKAVNDVSYSAFLLRINFLESNRRLPFWKTAPLSRVFVASRRLPTMHRDGWDGPKAGSNMMFAWFIFEKGNFDRKIEWFDWKDYEDLSVSNKEVS